jgi:poly-gamma-glutamate capsule biosynthesis protein CapA/YwtB (metallophosphatase superfamily)
MHKVLLFLAGLFFQLFVHAQDTTRLSLLFAGDIMQHDSNIAAAYNPATGKYDYSACFEYVAPIIQSADLAIGNLELTLAGPPFKGYPQFSSPDALAAELKRSGFDVLVTANNHSLDRRRKGLERTTRVLDSLQIIHTGTFRDSAERATVYPLIIEKNGFRLSLLNYTYATNGIPVTRPNVVNMIDTVQIKKDLAKARNQKSDAIIVFMHWGDEYQSLPNKEQKRLTSLCFREGARLVIGAHPHVLQPMEWRKEKDQFVVYSLGNFISGQRPRYRDGGAMLWIDLQKVSNGATASTSISNAEYELAWVQKSNDVKKDFVMLPFRYFESDTTFIEDKLLRDAFSVFKKDSRELYAKHNVNVLEKVSYSNLDSLQYSIRLGSFSEEQSNAIITNPVLQSYGLEKLNDDGPSLWLAGKFLNRKEAELALSDIQKRTELKNIRIVKRIAAQTTTSSGSKY